MAISRIDVTITVRHLDTEAGVWAEFHDHDGNAWLPWQPTERPSSELIAA